MGTKKLIEEEDIKAEVRLRSTLEDLAAACLRYQNITKANSLGAGSGKTKLDKERTKLCLREIVSHLTNEIDFEFYISYFSFADNGLGKPRKLGS